MSYLDRCGMKGQQGREDQWLFTNHSQTSDRCAAAERCILISLVEFVTRCGKASNLTVYMREIVCETS